MVTNGLIAVAIVLLTISNAQIAYAGWKLTRFLNEPEPREESVTHKPEPVPIAAGYEKLAEDQKPKPTRVTMSSLRAQLAVTMTPEQEREKRMAERNG